MKKKIVCILMAVLALTFIFAGCGSGTQEISFQGIKMEIPSSWELQKDTQTEKYAVYEQLNSIGHDYQLIFQDTFALLPKCNNNLEEAGKFFKKTTEDDATYSDVSDPVAGKLAGKYDMQTITCKHHAKNPMEKTKESVYPCKLIRVYMGDHDVKIECCAAEGNFEAFDNAISKAVCQ